MEIIELTFVLRCLKGVAMVTNFWAESAKLAHPTFIHHIGIPKQVGVARALA